MIFRRNLDDGTLAQRGRGTDKMWKSRKLENPWGGKARPSSRSSLRSGGGGRYDDLTGIFGLKNMSGVGISFGLDRIALVMEEVGLFPEAVLATSKALFLNFGDKEALYAMKAIGKLRQKGIKVELYPDNSKIDKQFKHADRRGIPFAVIVGESEIEREEFGLKNLATGEQQKVDFATLVTLLQ
jgi:histidyl-tRNA synthetase